MLSQPISLIHPPPGSLHEPVPANKIVIAGDSAGANLTLVLLQTLLTLKRADHKIRFHGADVPIELPAGAAGISPWCDVSRSMPSIVTNAKYDYLDIRLQQTQLPGEALDTSIPFDPMPFPSDSIWPVSPPRVEIFCATNMLLHPLVSPLIVKPELWRDCPPVFISVGEESLTDEGLITARRMHRGGVSVVAHMFEGMPHCHGMIMIDTPVGKQFFTSLAQFVRDAAAGQVTAEGSLTHWGFGLKKVERIALEKVCHEISEEEVEDRIATSTRWRLEREKQLHAEWRERARL
ncbi:hypothetical protein N7470_010129 [Penicillium chermesinum]|nr:hypothetical protein N7470_010129 [Penicillium chermesinum]